MSIQYKIDTNQFEKYLDVKINLLKCNILEIVYIGCIEIRCTRVTKVYILTKCKLLTVTYVLFIAIEMTYTKCIQYIVQP